MRPTRTHAAEKVYSALSSEVRVAYASHPGRVRTSNEDSIALPSATEVGETHFRSKGCLFLVADGVGGQSSGGVASRLAVQAAIRAYYATNQEADARTALVAAFNSAHERVREASRQADCKGMATTLVGVAVRDSSAFVASVGDSRAYLWRNGTLSQISRDHSLVAELVRRGALTEDQARTHPHRHVITQSIGGDADISPDIREIALEQGDRLLLCTDGLTDVVDVEKIAGIVGQPSLSKAAEDLVKAALAAGGPDNVTVLLIESHRAEQTSSRTSILDHPVAFPVFLGLGLLLVLLILYLAARAVLTPGVPEQPSPLPTTVPLLCGAESSSLAYYLEGKVTSVNKAGQGSACKDFLVGVVNSSGVFTFCVNADSNDSNDKYQPAKGDLITAALRWDGAVGEALYVDVYKPYWIFPWQKPWGNWIWNGTKLNKLCLYASKVGERWVELPEGVNTPLVLCGTWRKDRHNLPWFDIKKTYTWDSNTLCFSLVKPREK